MEHSILAPQTLIFVIPIIAIVMGLGTGMVKIYLDYRKRRDMFALYHQERMAAIDKGIELPPLPQDFFHEEAKPSRVAPHGTLLSGLILVFLGLALLLALHFTPAVRESAPGTPLFALIPVAVGVACLIYYFSVGRKLAAVMEEERKARLAQATQAR